MSIVLEHIPYYREMFSKDFYKEPFLMIGIPEIIGEHIPKDFAFRDLKEYLIAHRLKKVDSLDLFDKKASIIHDLNKPVPKKYHNKYKVVIDIGTLEHIYDTKVCFENYLRMVADKGILVLVTPVNGYFGHGLHVFNPETIIDTLKKNNFKIKYKKYISSTGIEVKNPGIKKNVLILLVAQKIKSFKKFNVPQQLVWKDVYDSGVRNDKSKSTDSNLFDLGFVLRNAKRKLINKLPQNIIDMFYGKW